MRVILGLRWYVALVSVTTLGLLTNMTFSGAPAMAAAPETPGVMAPTAVTATSATLNGSLNPTKAGELGTYEFLYEPLGVECGEGERAPEPAGIALGLEKEAVSVDVTGLLPNTKYTFCLLARNAAEETTESLPLTFTTLPGAAMVGNESLTKVGATSVVLGGQIDAGGSPTAYRVEYGPSKTYGSTTSEVSIGAPTSPVGTLTEITNLQPETSYHLRIVATNALGIGEGVDVPFRTLHALGSSESALPDDRAYELVSTLGTSEDYVPDRVIERQTDVKTSTPFQVSADGNSATYSGQPPGSGEGGNGAEGEGLGNQYLSTRTAAGWKASDITPPVQEGESGGIAIESRYEAFSSDLSVGLMHSAGQALASTAEPKGPEHCNVLYSHTGSSDFMGYHAMFSTTQTPGHCGYSYVPEPLFAGISESDSQVIFQTGAALIAGVAEAPGEGKANLYDSTEGRLSLVNVLPGTGARTAREATFGAPQQQERMAPDLSNVISRDGSRLFWTDLEEGPDMEHIFVREHGETTVPVSNPDSTASAQFWTATPDGKDVFYMEGETLWRFDVDEGTRNELVGTGSGVQGVVGINESGEDGAYVYFVANGVLTNTENGSGLEAQAGLPNLYLLHAGNVVFIATLTESDNRLSVGGGNSSGGDWAPDLGDRTAEVSADGRSLVFESTLPLTGYDNSSLKSGSQATLEVFVYNADAGRVFCASCNPAGAPPEVESEAYGGAAFVPASLHTAYMLRVISGDGNRVFFETSQPLVPQDTNGAQDVYEWEREGADTSCPRDEPALENGGCIFLLSGGESNDFSYLIEGDSTGENVFFLTRSQLLPQDRNERMDLYDARVGGGFPETSLACTGTGCQGVPPTSPVFATPSSATFSGLGNFEPSTSSGPITSRRKTGAEVKAEKLLRALKTCRRKAKNKRRTCEKRAKKLYAPAKKKGKR